MSALYIIFLASVAIAQKTGDSDFTTPPIMPVAEDETANPPIMPVAETCAVPDYKGDGYCDDENNVPECDYDGGDCCGNTGKSWDRFCETCACLDPEHKPACHCGVKNDGTSGNDGERIVNGTPTAANEYPWMALYHNNKSMCGASILNSLYVLTAAHCTEGSTADVSTVRVGEHNRGTADDGALNVKVAEIFQHPNYSRRGIVNDISILKLATPLNWTSKISPICLPTDASKTYSGVKGVASGWGQLGSLKPSPYELYHVELDVYAQDDCMKWGSVSDSKICAGGKEGKAVCSGDSGGPLVTKESNQWTLIGVSSYVSSEGCEADGWPSVFSRVTANLDWINDKISDGKFCPAPL